MKQSLNMRIMGRVVVMSVLALSIAACSSNKNPNGYNGTQAEGLGTNEPFVNSDAMAKALGVDKNTIYFDYNQNNVKSEYQYVIQANANYLKNHTSAKVRLEGNTDPRGSREYNIGLGQRRADAVEQALEQMGVSAQQIVTVSYGQERPAMTGDSEQAYAADRRVDIVYMSK